MEELYKMVDLAKTNNVGSTIAMVDLYFQLDWIWNHHWESPWPVCKAVSREVKLRREDFAECGWHHSTVWTWTGWKREERKKKTEHLPDYESSHSALPITAAQSELPVTDAHTQCFQSWLLTLSASNRGCSHSALPTIAAHSVLPTRDAHTQSFQPWLLTLSISSHRWSHSALPYPLCHDVLSTQTISQNKSVLP